MLAGVLLDLPVSASAERMLPMRDAVIALFDVPLNTATEASDAAAAGQDATRLVLEGARLRSACTTPACACCALLTAGHPHVLVHGPSACAALS